MNLSSERLPNLQQRVLVWDASLNRWIIGQIQMSQGTKFWVFDPKIFHGIYPERYTHWQPLPEKP